MHFHILTIFPEMVMAVLGDSVTGKAIKAGKIEVSAVNIRDFTNDPHKKVDDYPYSGGPGLVMQAQPIYDAWESVCKSLRGDVRTLYMTPQGRTFNQEIAHDLSKADDLVILCGHYEGVDERVLDEIVTDNISVGDYVLTGGELPAMIVCDAVARLIPGVLHNDSSADTESFENGLLEYPQYSRPETWKGRSVPPVLLSGNHQKIDEFHHQMALLRTRERRPDLIEKYDLSDDDIKFLQSHSSSDMIL